MFGTLGVPELAIIGCIVLLLWGGKKFPELMKGLGQGITNFRRGVQSDDEEE